MHGISMYPILAYKVYRKTQSLLSCPHEAPKEALYSLKYATHTIVPHTAIKAALYPGKHSLAELVNKRI